MTTTAWVAAAATAIALAIPSAAAADSIVLAGGHHWDRGDRAHRWSGGEPGGGGFQPASLAAVGGGSGPSVAQSVTASVEAPAAPSTGPINTSPVGGGAPAVPPSNGGIIQQVAPIAFTSTPILGLLGPVQPVAGVAGPLFGFLPFSGSGLILFQHVAAQVGAVDPPSSVVAAAVPASPAPEPASLVLFGTGLVGAVVRKRWFK